MDDDLDGSRPGTDLHAALLDAHESGDLSSLIALYSKAAELAGDDGDVDAACFFLTHAYVFALQAGDARASVLHAALAALGREE